MNSLIALSLCLLFACTDAPPVQDPLRSLAVQDGDSASHELESHEEDRREVSQDFRMGDSSFDQDPLRINFGRNTSALPEEAYKVLEEVALRMTKEEGLRLRIEGFSDSKGPADHNRMLANRRALEVKKELIELGINPGRIKTSSHGEDGLISVGDSESDRALNRRVELIFE